MARLFTRKRWVLKKNPVPHLQHVPNTKSCSCLAEVLREATKSGMTMYNIAGYQSFVHQLDPRIRSLRCTKELLEGRKSNIITFTTQFHKANEHLDKEMPRIVVEFFWVKVLSLMGRVNTNYE